MFWKRKKQQQHFDKTGKFPVVRTSICTGEQVAGFKDAASGKFEEVMLIRDGSDWEEFLRLYDLDEAEVRREY